jgi:MFS family permease
MALSVTARRVLLASIVGSTIEWFDFFLYGTAAGLVFNKLFFPTADPLVSLLLSYVMVWPFITATLSTLLAETFPAEVRYSGITFGYQVGAALVGGTAPLIATLLLSADHGHWRWIAAYIVVLSTISLIAAATPADPVVRFIQREANE